MPRRFLTLFLVVAVVATVSQTATSALLQERPDEGSPPTIGLVASTISSSIDTTTPSPTGRYLIQFGGPITPTTLEALRGLGAEVVGYIPDYAFIIEPLGALPNRLAAMPGVVAFLPWQPQWSLSPDLNTEEPGLVAISLLPDAVATPLVDELNQRGIVNSVAGSTVVALVTDPILAELATIDGVSWIAPYRMPRTYNDAAAGIVGVTAANANGYDGTDQIVAVTDTGLGSGIVATAHRDIPSARIVAILDYPDSDAFLCWDAIPDGPRDVDGGHGTHVAGSIVSGGTPTGPNQGLGQGMASGAQLVFQAVEDYRDYTGIAFCNLADGYYLGGLSAHDLESDILQDAYDLGARIHSNSWGSDVTGEYTATSQSMDQYMWENPDMLVVVAAGNDGVDADLDGYVDDDSMGAPATAKNVLTVGASEGARSDAYPCDTGLLYTTCLASGGVNDIMTYGTGWPTDFGADPLFSDPSAGNAEQMAAFSSRGPTDDGRIKPDVVAPGTWILSTYSDLFQQEYDVGFNPQNGLFQYDGWGNPFDKYYKYYGGTSMATPIVSGAAALVRQYYTQSESHTPSAALMKATLINSAVDLADETNDGAASDLAIPNVHEGWGRIDADEATDGDHVFADNVPVDPLETVTYHLGVDGGGLLKITVVWTDQASSLAAATNLVNDLDLTVTAPDGTTEYLGNVFAGGWSVTGGDADSLNNVENVYRPVAEAGTWTVEVVGTNIPQGPQPFALVVHGGEFIDIEPPAWPAGASLGLTGASDTTVTVDWSGNPATDTVGVVAYDVYVDGAFDQSVAGTSATILNLAEATIYSIAVEARDEAGNSTNDGPSVAASTLDITAPFWPDTAIGVREILETSVELSWVEATDMSGIASYTVKNGAEILATTTETSLVLSGLSPGTTHSITITAEDPSGNSTVGPATEVTTAPDFADTNGHLFEDDIAWLAGRGITVGCGGSNFCPGDSLSRAQMASLLARAFELAPPGGNRFDDVAGVHAANINAIAEAGITQGCVPGGLLYCPTGLVSRAQMASFLARAFGLDESTANAFSDDDGSVHEGNIDAIAIVGITLGCETGLYCGSRVVTRGQVAAFLHRGFVNLDLE